MSKHSKEVDVSVKEVKKIRQQNTLIGKSLS
jgi:hypothetical protein